MIGFIDYLQFLHKHKFVGSEITRITDFCKWNPFKIQNTQIKIRKQRKATAAIQYFYSELLMKHNQPVHSTELVFYEIEREIRSV